jgi:hypothetical protein
MKRTKHMHNELEPYIIADLYLVLTEHWMGKIKLVVSLLNDDKGRGIMQESHINKNKTLLR